ncbi:MAG: arylamine N-acetyltransferase family protein [Geminicoccaceae bacterium]
MTSVDLDAYLDRVGLKDALLPPTRETLLRLQAAHLLHVPFENLDIGWKRPIRLDETLLFDKIVNRGRGGFCYELNGLTVGMLGRLGFDAHLMAASVCEPETGDYGPDAGHACIRVALDPPMLFEVGFGDSALTPLELVPDLVQHDGRFPYRLQKKDVTWTLQSQPRDDQQWVDCYRFTETPWSLTAFQAMCDYQQFSSKSHFVNRKVCSIAKEDNGRVTLTGERLIITLNGVADSRQIPDDAMFDALLETEFGITKASG